VSTLAHMLGLTLAIALLAGGLVSAFASANALKKVAALSTALVGACLALALLGAPGAAVLAAVAIAFAYCVAGVAVAVRLQEAYGSVEVSELDAADDQDEPRESGA
jgi:multisubunit Na+/H+ antiporter MnhC subunit